MSDRRRADTEEFLTFVLTRWPELAVLGPVHVHDGDAILRVVSGVIVVRCGNEQRQCTAGQLVVAPPRVLHGFRVVEESVLALVAEYDIGTLYPVRTDTGRLKLIEVHRRDMPWGRPPPAGQDWTSDDHLQQILDRLDDRSQ